MVQLCPCCSGLSYQTCCHAFHIGFTSPPTPEALMRSRYSAYVLHLIDYLIQTTHPLVRNLFPKKDLENWAKANEWLKLEILSARADKVRFKAHYQNHKQYFIHYEDSTFKKQNGIWYYLKGSSFVEK